MSDQPSEFEQDKAQEPSADTRELVLVKRGSRFVFRYAPGQEQQMLDTLVRMAQDPSSDLDWFDAAVLSHQIGQRIGAQLERIRLGAGR